MRQVILDTETTGLSVVDGHRIIELGCIEVINRRVTGQELHWYLNPEREIDEGAINVHGITLDQLQDAPKFGDIAGHFIEFVRGAELIIHNAPFDVGFLNAELGRFNLPTLELIVDRVVDTLEMARRLHPGKRKSLDALCERYEISNAHRTRHGALLDAGLLAEVWLAMTRGQESLDMLGAEDETDAHYLLGPWPPQGLAVVRATPEERAAHLGLLQTIAKKATVVWPMAAAG